MITSLAPGEYTVVVHTPEAFGAVPLTSLGRAASSSARAARSSSSPGPASASAPRVYGGCLSDEEYNVTFQPSATYIA